MIQRVDLFSNLLLRVFDKQTKPWEYKNVQAAEIYNKVGRAWPSFGRPEELEAHLPSLTRKKTDFGRQAMYLEPITDGGLFVPLLSLTCDWRSLPEVRMRLALCFIDQGDHQVKAIGYRFESPEGPGRHNYYHAQPITKLADVALPGCPDWLPEKQPTFPLDGDGPVALALCILVSLYGLPYVQQMENELGGALKDVLRPRNWETVPRPKYWEVNWPGGKRWYESYAPRSELEAYVKDTHSRRSRVKPVTNAEYQACPIAQRDRH